MIDSWADSDLEDSIHSHLTLDIAHLLDISLLVVVAVEQVAYDSCCWAFDTRATAACDVFLEVVAVDLSLQDMEAPDSLSTDIHMDDE